MIDYLRRYIKNHPDNILIVGVFILASILNLQFLSASNINYTMSGHDEYIAVREVYSILHPISIKHLFMAIISGDVLYYGRIMFYADSLFAFLPFKIFGLKGMVYAIRMIHVIYTLSGVYILGNTFIEKWGYRAIFFIGATTLYYSAYFFMVPKPDPLQILFFSIFFYFFKKNQFNFGKYFILLGITYGVKFNIITLLPFIFILPFLMEEVAFLINVKRMITSIFYFLTGLIIAIPCLLLSLVKPIFLSSYFNSTFGYVEQYDDDSSLTVYDWIKTGWFGAYNGGNIYGYLLVTIVILILYLGIKRTITKGEIGNELIILVSGLFLFIPVLILTKRIWPHYLWTGYIFIFLAIIIFLQEEHTNKIVRILSFTLLGLVLIGSLKCTYDQGKELFSLQDHSKQIIQNGDEAYRYLKNKSRKFIVIQDLSVPYPFAEMIKNKPYHPFSSILTDTISQKFILQGFISPEILQRNRADYILTNKINFNDSLYDLKTSKDSTMRHNNDLIRNEFGKTIFFDTAFGKVKVYRVVLTSK